MVPWSKFYKLSMYGKERENDDEVKSEALILYKIQLMTPSKQDFTMEYIPYSILTLEATELGNVSKLGHMSEVEKFQELDN